jgi:hypothetical protein
MIDSLNHIRLSFGDQTSVHRTHPSSTYDAFVRDIWSQLMHRSGTAHWQPPQTGTDTSHPVGPHDPELGTDCDINSVPSRRSVNCVSVRSPRHVINAACGQNNAACGQTPFWGEKTTHTSIPFWGKDHTHQHSKKTLLGENNPFNR